MTNSESVRVDRVKSLKRKLFVPKQFERPFKRVASVWIWLFVSSSPLAARSRVRSQASTVPSSACGERTHRGSRPEDGQIQREVTGTPQGGVHLAVAVRHLPAPARPSHDTRRGTDARVGVTVQALWATVRLLSPGNTMTRMCCGRSAAHTGSR
jgi:hypothetical protein